MTTIRYFVPSAAAALVFAVCAGNALAGGDNAANTAAKPARIAPTKDALVTLERSSYEARKSKDSKFWGTFLSDKFVGYGSSGKLDKASATKKYADSDCEVRSYTLSDEQIRPLGDGAALITYKSTVDGKCGGQQLPPNSWAASVYVRDGAKWKSAFHAEAPIVDPKAATAKPADKQEAPKKVEAKTAARNAASDTLLEAERGIWEAWKAHDANRLADLTTSDISFINIFGTFFATKAEALKDWTSEGCKVKSVSVTNATATMLSPTVGILTFNGGADGTCFGQNVGPIWGTSVYVKVGKTWKWTFGINLPAS